MMKKVTFANRSKRMLALALTTGLLMSLNTQAALASSYINTITVSIDIDLVEGDDLPRLATGYNDEDVEVKIAENNRYDLEYAEWSNDSREVEMGKTYNLKITLDAEDDYEFRNTYNASKVKVKGGTFVSARRGRTSDELVVTVKTKPAKGTFDVPDDVDWKNTNSSKGNFGVASWGRVEDAAYDVVLLYNDDKVVHRVDDIKRTTYNFYPYMTKEGDYSFRVRAVPSTDEMASYATKSEWEYSDTLYVEKDEVSDGTGQGLEDTGNNGDTPVITNPELVGWIASNNKWFFRYPDGTYLRNCWGKIDGIWYLFADNGEMLTGWHNRNDRYYYMNSSGAMHTGWLLDNNIWYYLDPDGAMHTGWLTVNGATYYMENNGAMATGWKEVDGQFYYFYPDGHKAVNEVISGFYVDHNGIWHRP